MSNLNNNTTQLEALLAKVNALPEAGGIDLPTLTNEGDAEDLMLNKQLIDQDGNKITGTFTIEEELTEQENLLYQIQAALEGKAAGGGSEDIMRSYIEGRQSNIVSNAEFVSDYIFSHNPYLETVKLPNATSISMSAFSFCEYLTLVDLSSVQMILNSAFENSGLSALIIRNTIGVVVSYDENMLTDTPISNGVGYIYVPRELIESYRSADVWSSYADQFRVLEEYTSDGTVTGEFIPPQESLVLAVVLLDLETMEFNSVTEIEADSGMIWGDWLGSNYNAQQTFMPSDDGSIMCIDSDATEYYVVSPMDPSVIVSVDFPVKLTDDMVVFIVSKDQWNTMFGA